VPRRDEAYLGVMLDDLTTQELSEPYRMFTSRAEYRLLLRHDNADIRLSAFGHAIGLLSGERFESVQRRSEALAETQRALARTNILPGGAVERRLTGAELPTVNRPTRGIDYLKRPDVDGRAVSLMLDAEPSADIVERVEIAAKYDGYLERQRAEAERLRQLEDHGLPADLDYESIPGLRTEARMRLSSLRPTTVGQASRIFGVTPSDVGILLMRVRGRA
jgi:tRNA uridine 5-carboxymethylaminomethyl modification enzyme